MLNYYIIDTETNGLKAGFHEISQISIIRYSDRNQLNKFIKILYPNRTSQAALDATGRTMADLRQGIPQAEAVDACNKFLEEDGVTPEHRCIIAHNASFDRRFCHSLWESEKQVFPANCWLDTMYAAKDYMTKTLGLEKPKKGLQDACKTCGLQPKTGAHNAISDTQNTYFLHAHLVKQGFDFLPYIKRTPHNLGTSTNQKQDEE